MASPTVWVVGLVNFEVDVGVGVCVVGAASCYKHFFSPSPIEAQVWSWFGVNHW